MPHSFHERQNCARKCWRCPARPNGQWRGTFNASHQRPHLLDGGALDISGVVEGESVGPHRCKPCSGFSVLPRVQNPEITVAIRPYHSLSIPLLVFFHASSDLIAG